MTDAYVALTGGLNNAGDYLIASCARDLFARVRPDRTLIERPAFEPFSAERLEEVNSSRALLLLGGPAIQPRMIPRVYPMVDDLDRIRVPIVMVGLGWNSIAGSWGHTHRFRLSRRSRRLLERMNEQRFPSSVRDYHTLNVCFRNGTRNVVMTGCPAYYSLAHLGQEPTFSTRPRRLSFSIGRMFDLSRSIRRGMCQTLLAVRDAFRELDVTAVFHHSPDPARLKRVYPHALEFAKAQHELTEWLKREGIPYVDISGGAAAMVKHYQSADMHIGYRVHAHIYMSSISRPSILIAEDGRGHAAHEVMGGTLFAAAELSRIGAFAGPLRRAGVHVDRFRENRELARDVVAFLRYEMENSFVRTRAVRTAIDAHFQRMVGFLRALP